MRGSRPCAALRIPGNLSIPLGSLRTADSHLWDGAGTSPCGAPRQCWHLPGAARSSRQTPKRAPHGESRCRGAAQGARPRSGPGSGPRSVPAEGGSHTAFGEEGVPMLHVCGSPRSAERAAGPGAVPVTGYRRGGGREGSPGTDGSAPPREGLSRWGVMAGPRCSPMLCGSRRPQSRTGAQLLFGTAGEVNRPRERRPVSAGRSSPAADYRSRHARRAGAVGAGRTPGPAWRSRRPRSPGGPRRAPGRERRGLQGRAGERLEERDPATRHGPG